VESPPTRVGWLGYIECPEPVGFRPRRMKFLLAKLTGLNVRSAALPARITALEWTADGAAIVTGCEDGAVRLVLLI